MRIIEAFRHYATTPNKPYPSREIFLENLTRKMAEIEFIGDIDALLRPGIEYDPAQAFELVCDQFISMI